MNVIPYTDLSDLTTYLSDNSKALYGVRSRRKTPQYTLIQNTPASVVLHYNTRTHSLIAKSIAEGHDHLTRFFTTWFFCEFYDMGLNTPGAWTDMHSSIVILGEWERQVDSRRAPPSKKGPLSVLLEVGCVGSGSAGVVDFEDDVRRWIECRGSAVGCVVAFCVDVLGQSPRARSRPWVWTVLVWEACAIAGGNGDGTRKAVRTSILTLRKQGKSNTFSGFAIDPETGNTSPCDELRISVREGLS